MSANMCNNFNDYSNERPILLLLTVLIISKAQC
jgi:hypothetical protein